MFSSVNVFLTFHEVTCVVGTRSLFQTRKVNGCVLVLGLARVSSEKPRLRLQGM